MVDVDGRAASAAVWRAADANDKFNRRETLEGEEMEGMIREGECKDHGSRRRWLIGMVLVFIVATIWVFASFIVQMVEAGAGGIQPLILSYICNSLFVVLLPVVEGGRILSRFGYTKRWARDKCQRMMRPMRKLQKRAMAELKSRLFLYTQLKVDDKADNVCSSSSSSHFVSSAAPPSPLLTTEGPNHGDGGCTSTSAGEAKHKDSGALITPALADPYEAPQQSVDGSTVICPTGPNFNLDSKGAVFSGGKEVGHGDVNVGLVEGGAKREEKNESVLGGDHFGCSGAMADRERIGARRGEGEERHVAEIVPFSRKETAAVSLLICPFWFLAQYTFNLSLTYTTVTSNTILSTTSGLFTFVLSVALLGESFSWLKMVSVFLCMIGTIVVSLTDKDSSGENSTPVSFNGHFNRHLVGDCLTLSSSMIYAIYTSLIKRFLPDENDVHHTRRIEHGRQTSDEEGGADDVEAPARSVNFMEFFGYVGLFNSLLIGPFVLAVHLLGHSLSLTWKQFGLVFCKGIFDNVLSDVLWAKAVMLTTTTAATVGLSIQIPVATIVDIVFKGVIPGLGLIVGTILILAGFFGIYLPATGVVGQAKDREEGDVDMAAGEPRKEEGVRQQSK